MHPANPLATAIDLICIFALGGLCALLDLLEAREFGGDHVAEKGWR